MALKMDKTMIIVSAVVGSLGLLSAILGFSAEGSKLTATQVYLTVTGECYYPPNPAVALGICAIIFLVISQITAAAVGGCCGCCMSRAATLGTHRTIGVVCAVVSWLSAAIAWGMYVLGASFNDSGIRQDCDVLKDGIFAGGAVLALVATATGIASYFLLRRQPKDDPVLQTGEQQHPPGAGAAIAMGQPQVPPPTYQQNGAAPPPPHQGYGMQVPPTAPPAAQAQSYGHQQV